MTYSGIANIYTCINRFTMHNFYVAMGPADFLTATISLVAFFLCFIDYSFLYSLCLQWYFSSIPTNPFALPPWRVVYPWRSASLGRGGGLVKEERRERGSGRSRACEG